MSGQDVADELAKVIALSPRLAFQILAQRGRQAERELCRIPWPCHAAIVDKADAMHNAPLPDPGGKVTLAPIWRA
jgi:hypothetical protein